MHWVPPALVVACAASLGAFIAMRIDKRRAGRNAQRISERGLAAWALLGGWPGLVGGGIVFRHKTRATGFKLKAAGYALLHGVFVLALWWFVR